MNTKAMNQASPGRQRAATSAGDAGTALPAATAPLLGPGLAALRAGGVKAA
jgi:hypothetical protein